MAPPFVGCTDQERAHIAALIQAMEKDVPLRVELLQALAGQTPRPTPTAAKAEAFV
jgi:hypothetical protein